MHRLLCIPVLLLSTIWGSALTVVTIHHGQWRIDGALTYPNSPAAGLLLNVRMVNATFEDANRKDFDPEANTDRFIARIPEYAANGVRAFTLNLQGGAPGYEGALNSGFKPDGSLKESARRRLERVIEACDSRGVAVILGVFYQRQDQVLKNAAALKNAVRNTAKWIAARRYQHVLLEIANEAGHPGFDHPQLKDPDGILELIQIAHSACPGLLVSASGLGDGAVGASIAREADFLLVHFNSTPVRDIGRRIASLKAMGKPIVCNEDAKTGVEGVRALEACIRNGISWGYMNEAVNQRFPFAFQGAQDDPLVYAAMRQCIEPVYFPPPESQGGWRKLEDPDEIRSRAGMDPAKLSELRQWLLQSDDRNFAAVVIRNGYVVLEVERGNSAKNDSRRVASVSKAVCATVLAIASEWSQAGRTPRKMKFEDPAFQFIPWAQPLSDPRKEKITVRQLLNHTSGICPEATGAPNDGSWNYILGHTGDPRTAKLAFDPGTACGYSSHALAHAALVCETVTGKPYDEFAIEALFKPIGIEHWEFQFYNGDPAHGRHPSHGLGMPARDLARIAYCMLHDGRWNGRPVIPQWYVDETAEPTHSVETPEMRWKLNPKVFTDGWELPARHWPPSGRSGEGIPVDARSKPGSGGQLIAFVPSLDLVVTRQTGSSGDWGYEEYLRRACAAVLEKPRAR